jgi:hypothetical protein
MVDGGALANVQIDGADAVADGDYSGGTPVDLADFSWVFGE